jgi:hypothetical protein
MKWIWKSKPKATIEDVALGLVSLAKGDNGSNSVLSADCGVDGETINRELTYLRLFSVEFGVRTALHKEQLQSVLTAYQKEIAQMSRRASSDDALLQEINARIRKYNEAARSSQQGDPSWSVGKLFAELCGGELDVALIAKASIEFVGTVNAVSDFLRRITII